MKHAKGFTLIELLIVISVIGILSSFMMANYIGVQQRGRDQQRKSDLKQIQAALELYRADYGRYPCTTGWVQSSATAPWITDTCTGGTAFSPTYMAKIPADPLTASTKLLSPWSGPGTAPSVNNYAYWSSGDLGATTNCRASGQYYILFAGLENKNDPDRLEVGSANVCGSWYATAKAGLPSNLYIVGNP